MSKQDDGGPAFPQAKVTVLAEDGTPNEAAAVTHDGMSLRDHFAGLALQGICAHDTTWGWGSTELVAQQAYELADQMLKARKARRP
ncbi:hypothetical protein [Pseudorhodoferax sp. Leaf274]|uniref:hypothetical protein n=1 Tax=Pseudorhodoferax sp. Leaf274 TaxID=1736318 RepID=UPI00070304D1|nr:hypothetical protein [Pseudorhodoferax sp. Leaf274]KQP36108.1 hypothetical protein ASF44_16190 [Pseudorhodoferax sp. Leaf274]